MEQEPVCAGDSADDSSSNNNGSGLRKRMDATCSGSSELRLGDTRDASAFKDVAAVSEAASSADEQPDLTGERGCFVLLITLYALQGSLLGLASGTLPFLIQARYSLFACASPCDSCAGEAVFLCCSGRVQVRHVAVWHQAAVVPCR